jgi:cell division transport system ATP-binding protein
MIEIQHGYKTYPGAVHALKDISLKIENGEFVFLTGPSGAGKTTLFRILSAYDRLTSGRISVLGTSLDQIDTKSIPFFRREIGVVYQDFRLLNTKTVFDNVALPLVIRGDRLAQIENQVLDVLDQVSLIHKKDEFPDHLSGGEQQRVAIARAIIHRPGLLVADEPTGNLDPQLSKEILRLFETVNRRGTTVFIATHDLSIVEMMDRRRLHLVDGRIARTA